MNKTNRCTEFQFLLVDCFWNVMAHAQKPDFVFQRNGRVHLNRQFSRLLAAEVCASAVVMLDTPCSEVVKGTGYPLHSLVSPSHPLPCVTLCHHVSTGLYYYSTCFGQSFCPSSGVLSRTSALVHFMQLWPFATRSRMGLQFHPTPGSKWSSQLHKMYQSRCTAKNSWWWAERLA